MQHTGYVNWYSVHIVNYSKSVRVSCFSFNLQYAMFHKVYSFIAVIMVFVNKNVCVWSYTFISVHVYCTCSTINNLQWTKKRQNQNVPVANVKGAKYGTVC